MKRCSSPKSIISTTVLTVEYLQLGSTCEWKHSSSGPLADAAVHAHTQEQNEKQFRTWDGSFRRQNAYCSPLFPFASFLSFFFGFASVFESSDVPRIRPLLDRWKISFFVSLFSFSLSLGRRQSIASIDGRDPGSTCGIDACVHPWTTPEDGSRGY